MNDAHLHMVVNHFPIIGTIFGLGILFIGMLQRNIPVKNTAFTLFIISAIFAAFSMATGDGAERIVVKLPDVTKEIIHTHEEIAEKFAIVLYALGAISIGGIYMNIKKLPNAKLISFLALIVAILGILLAKDVGTTGGEIRHTEIRTDSIKPIISEQNISKEVKEDDKD